MSNHPTGIAGALSSLILLAAGLLGVDLSSELSVAIVGALVAIVSAFSPRLVEFHAIDLHSLLSSDAPSKYEGSK